MKTKTQEISLVSQSSAAEAAQTVAWVDDLLIEIFLRLPMKSLVRFKSVSKRWQSLISDPGFSILRNPNPNPATGLIFQVSPGFQTGSKTVPYAYIVSLDNKSPQTRTLKLIDPWPYETTMIRSSCNGLLVCGSYVNLGSAYDYYVCNPTTNKYFKLPQMPDVQSDWLLQPMCLAFDPSKSPHYKVVCAHILVYDTTFRCKFLVYSSETGCWRKSRAEPFEASVDFRRGVYWNGAVHWVSCTETGKSIYFDPEKDQMSQEIMPTPPRVNSSYYFGESCGHLHYIGGCWDWRFDVYELIRDYSEWFVKYRIRDPGYSFGRNMLILCVVVRVNGHDDDSFSVLLIEGKLVRCNHLNKTRETIFEVEGAPFEQCFANVYLTLQHAESLCPV